MTHYSALRITGNESAIDVATAMPGEFNPTDYVHVHTWANGRGLTVTASYVPVGHGIAQHASRQRMDSAARKANPTARYMGSERMASIYGAFRWGSYIREYRIS